jgi:hypothetical protein
MVAYGPSDCHNLYTWIERLICGVRALDKIPWSLLARAGEPII